MYFLITLDHFKQILKYMCIHNVFKCIKVLHFDTFLTPLEFIQRDNLDM